MTETAVVPAQPEDDRELPRAPSQPAPFFRPLAFAFLGLAFAALLLVWTRAMAGAYPALTGSAISDGLFLLITLAVVGIARSIATSLWGESYLATLVVVSPIAPFVAALAVLLLYVPASSGAHANPLFLGLSTALGAWIFAAPPLMWLVQADKAQSRSYGEVVLRTGRAAERLKEVGNPSTLAACLQGPAAQAEVYLQWLDQELGTHGPPGAGFRYANATGYINLWRALHRLEESLVVLVCAPEAIAAGMYDALRLRGVKTGQPLIDKINGALATFGPMATPAMSSTPAAPVADTSAQPVALAVLAEVRHALNVDQDDTWERLIRQRNRLLRTVFMTSLVGLLLVALAVEAAVPPATLATAAVFYLVGALIGLFARLRAENRAGPAVDDYGLFEARLLATLLLSGLASVVGVVIVAFGSSVLVTATAPADLNAVFSLSGNARGLLAAAVFGLTPELLTGWLSKQSDAIMDELSSTNPTKGI